MENVLFLPNTNVGEFTFTQGLSGFCYAELNYHGLFLKKVFVSLCDIPNTEMITEAARELECEMIKELTHFHDLPQPDLIRFRVELEVPED